MTTSTPTTTAPTLSAGVMCFNAAGDLLIVNPTYKEYWNLPGGRVEPGETFRQAAAREVREELGIDVEPAAALVVACVAIPGKDMRNMVIFDGGVLSEEQQASITLQAEELGEHRFAPVDGTALAELAPPHLLGLLRTALEAREKGTLAYVEIGAQP
ncbi:NUDIX hydrolase [Actinobacteria bacterium OK074]|nr:NUDIX hydrolase [Actinobacteria bacterium OK074]